MGLPKQKFCKCGHDKKAHKNPLLSFSSECANCPCSEYMNRLTPTKLDYFYLFSVLIVGIMIIASAVIIVIETNPELNDAEDKIIKFTYSQLHSFLTLAAFVVFIFFFGHFILDPITNIIYSRKRKKYPISD